MQVKQEFIRTALSVHAGPRKPARPRKAPERSAPLSESLSFAEWGEEYRVLGVYRRDIIRGDDASLSLKLIRDAIALHGRPAVEAAVKAYAAEVQGTEPRHRKRPFTFFKPGIYEQYLPSAEVPKPTAADPLAELRNALALRKSGA